MRITIIEEEFYLLGFEVSNGHEYDIWIDQLEFFVGKPPPEEELCVSGMGGAGGAQP